jgi:hypothetical protein
LESILGSLRITAEVLWCECCWNLVLAKITDPKDQGNSLIEEEFQLQDSVSDAQMAEFQSDARLNLRRNTPLTRYAPVTVTATALNLACQDCNPRRTPILICCRLLKEDIQVSKDVST